MNRSAKDGIRSSPHYWGEGVTHSPIVPRCLLAARYGRFMRDCESPPKLDPTGQRAQPADMATRLAVRVGSPSAPVVTPSSCLKETLAQRLRYRSAGVTVRC